MASLWGEEFEVPSTQEQAKGILEKLEQANDPKAINRFMKSKTTPLETKINFVVKNVLKVLGHYKDSTQVIKTREELHNYIDQSIKNGIIAIDTETNNSLDPLTCKLMGGCIYTLG